MSLNSITRELRKSNLETKPVQTVMQLCLNRVGIVGIAFKSWHCKLHGQKFYPSLPH
jgi:hypothetical protein